jgi:acetyl-CoA acetyltransferase/uncharacterized OB-fold protein
LVSTLDVEAGAWTRTDAGAELTASFCRSCGWYQFPPTALCPRCLGKSERLPLSPRAELHAFSIIRASRNGYPDPYAVGFADFPEGVRVFGQVLLSDGPPALGGEVRVVAAPLRMDGETEVWSYAFQSTGKASTLAPVRSSHTGLAELPPQMSIARGREVVVVGVGMTSFGKQPGRSVASLGQEAISAALADAGGDPRRIQAAWCGSVYSGMLTGQRVLRDLGLSGIPTVNTENACSSGSTAFHEAALSVSRGDVDVALAFGVEQLSRFGGGTIPLDDADWQVRQGSAMPAIYAMRAQRYLMDHDYPASSLAQVAVKNRAHAGLNPLAQYQTPITADEVMASRPIADPLTLLECCPNSDGASAALLCSRQAAQSFSGVPISVRASAIASGLLESGPIDLTVDEITERTAAEAYRQAGVSPEDLSACELHDAFAISELIYYEALGLCAHGEGGRLLQSGATSLGGSIPVNPSGGLLSRGHPLGATGIAQIVEAVHQLRGEAGSRQVDRARAFLTHCTGGGIAGMDHGACTIHILVN